jgi:hypothetical protein
VLRGGALPKLALFSRFDVPDSVVWALIAGLGAILLSGGPELSPLETAGWNVACGSCFLFALRGISVENHWLARAGWPPAARGTLIATAAIFFLPLHLALTTAIGLFDAWFDFRGIRFPSSSANPFGFLRGRSSGDLNDKD